MTATIDYFFAPQSPWTYFGHARLAAIAQKAHAKISVRAIDLGKIFPVSGGLPLAKRAPQRQAYRLVELARWRDFLQLPINVQPKFFPVAGDPAAKLITACGAALGQEGAMLITGAILQALWVQERDIADPATLQDLLRECKLDAQLWQESQSLQTQALYDANNQVALDTQIFGAPSYVINGEIFWGQDRLDFLERKLIGV